MEHLFASPRSKLWLIFLLAEPVILSSFISMALGETERVISATDQNVIFTTEEMPQIFQFCGPKSATISPSGNISQLLGSSLTLVCRAEDSNRAPQYRWYFNNTDANVTSSNLTIESISWKNEGTYVCCTSDPHTRATGYASVSLRIKTNNETSSAQPQLPLTVFFGIVLGLAAGITLVGPLLCCFCVHIRRKKLQQPPPPPPISTIPSLPKDFSGSATKHFGSSTKPENSAEPNIIYQEVLCDDGALYQELER
nr:carcinoembryonic antigen-related cell adhesion molecule 20 isoform X2 [Zootoca vivipara]